MLTTAEATCLYAPIVRVLGYYDVFQHPLRADEIHLFLPEEGISAYELECSLAELAADGRVCTEDGFYFLPHRDRGVVLRRLAMEDRGHSMWRAARRMAWAMRFTPFVRGIFISGQLCRYLADEASDIDYFIVTAPERLWIVRTLFVIIRRTLLGNSRKYFCTNYYVTTDNLRVRERNPYVACEVASLKPIYNRRMFDRFLEQNSWVTDFYPNFTPERIEIREMVEGGHTLRGILERLVPRRFAAWLDRRLMRATENYWHRKFPHLGADAFDGALRTRRDESRAHPNDLAPRVLGQYHERLATYGIADD